MARPTPVSNGWISFVRPPGTILPVDVVTISTLPSDAHASATQKTAMMLAPVARPAGDGGLSVISSAAGRNAISCSRRRISALRKGTMVLLTDVMDSRLEVMQLCVAAVGAEQIVVLAVLDDAAPLDRDDPVSLTP